MRLIIEGVCKERGIEEGNVTDQHGVTNRQRNLVGRINGLAEHGFISTQQAYTLHQI